MTQITHRMLSCAQPSWRENTAVDRLLNSLRLIVRGVWLAGIGLAVFLGVTTALIGIQELQTSMTPAVPSARSNTWRTTSEAGYKHARSQRTLEMAQRQTKELLRQHVASASS